MRGKRLPVIAFLPLFAIAITLTPIHAQDVEWSTWNKVEFSGALGTMMRIFAGNGESITKSYIKDARSRSDQEKRSSILDLENPRFIEINHDAKTYTIMTFAQMAEYMKQMQRKADSAMAQARAQAAKEPPPKPTEEKQAEVDVKIDFRIEKPGEKQKIQGYDAERQFVIVETEAMVTPEGGGQAESAGRLIIFNDSWNARGVPIEQAQLNMAAKAASSPELQKTAQSTVKSSEGMITAILSDPKARAALEKTMKEVEKIEGFELKGTMHLVIVPPGMQFDRDKALADEKGGGGAGQTARSALGGMLRGALRGNQQQQQSDDPKQVTIARVRSEVRDIKTASLAGSLFEPPAGYREIPWAPPR
jgi:hypothetical protein